MYKRQTCDPAKVPYCITHALIEAVKGNVEEGLFFCGANVSRLDRMRSVRELMEELMRGKSSGMIDEAKLNDVAARIAPMLTPEQLSRLSAVMERLRQ